MSTRKAILALKITAAACLALLAALLIAGCAGSKGGGNIPPVNTQSPLVADGLVTAGWGASGFNVSGGPGAAEPGALVVLTDPANTTASITANPDGSFEIFPDTMLFDNTPGTLLTLTQYAGTLDESEPVDIIVPPM